MSVFVFRVAVFLGVLNVLNGHFSLGKLNRELFDIKTIKLICG